MCVLIFGDGPSTMSGRIHIFPSLKPVYFYFYIFALKTIDRQWTTRKTDGSLSEENLAERYLKF